MIRALEPPGTSPKRSGTAQDHLKQALVTQEALKTAQSGLQDAQSGLQDAMLCAVEQICAPGKHKDQWNSIGKWYYVLTWNTFTMKYLDYCFYRGDVPTTTATALLYFDQYLNYFAPRIKILQFHLNKMVLSVQVEYVEVIYICIH